MIIYGSVVNQFNVLYGNPDQYKYTGALLAKMSVEVAAPTFPLYGAVCSTITAPTRIKILGGILRTTYGVNRFAFTGAKVGTRFAGANILGLSISQIAIQLTFSEPACRYNISPFRSADVLKVIGGGNYQIVDSELVFDTAPTDTVTVIPFNRLSIEHGNICKLVATNTVPKRVEFKDIQVSGNFEFSLDIAGPWSHSLSIVDEFYAKAPELVADGSDFTKEIVVSATVYPRG